MTVLTNELRKSRKRRKCWECGRHIEVGEVYRYQFSSAGMYDAGSWQCCEQCDVLFRVLWALPGVYSNWSDESFEIRDGGRDIIQETDSLPLRRALAWHQRNWVQADGTLLPVQEVRDMLNYHRLDV